VLHYQVIMLISFIYNAWANVCHCNLRFNLYKCRLIRTLNSISRAWCKTIVTLYIKWGSYNSFVPSPRFVTIACYISLGIKYWWHLLLKCLLLSWPTIYSIDILTTLEKKTLLTMASKGVSDFTYFMLFCVCFVWVILSWCHLTWPRMQLKKFFKHLFNLYSLNQYWYVWNPIYIHVPFDQIGPVMLSFSGFCVTVWFIAQLGKTLRFPIIIYNEAQRDIIPYKNW